MKVFIVYWHPEPHSFNHAMFHKAYQTFIDVGADAKTSDLYAMHFNPVSSRENFYTVKDPDYLKLQLEEMYATEKQGFVQDLDIEMQKLEWCELMVWQFPLWWFGLPAVFKGWVDRVFAMGRVYGGGKIYEKGIFQGKRALLSLTTGGAEAAFQPDGFNGDIKAILRPIHRGMLQFVGFAALEPQIVYGPARMTNEQRERELEKYAERLKHIQDEQPIDVGRY